MRLLTPTYAAYLLPRISPDPRAWQVQAFLPLFCRNAPVPFGTGAFLSVSKKAFGLFRQRGTCGKLRVNFAKFTRNFPAVALRAPSSSRMPLNLASSSSHEPLCFGLLSVALRRWLGSSSPQQALPVGGPLSRLRRYHRSSSPHAISDCAGTPSRHTWATKGIFSDVHAAEKNI